VSVGCQLEVWLIQSCLTHGMFLWVGLVRGVINLVGIAKLGVWDCAVVVRGVFGFRQCLIQFIMV